MSNFEFHFDFGSPNAYLSHKVIPDIEARRGVKCNYIPVLLGGVFKLTNNQSPMQAYQTASIVALNSTRSGMSIITSRGGLLPRTRSGTS